MDGAAGGMIGFINFNGQVGKEIRNAVRRLRCSPLLPLALCQPAAETYSGELLS
jgi:hypothetical protein